MNISFVLLVRTEQLGSHWTHFDESRYLSIFRKSVQKIQVLLTYDTIWGAYVKMGRVVQSWLLHKDGSFWVRFKVDLGSFQVT